MALIGAAVTIGNVAFSTFSGRNSAYKSGLQCLLRAEIIRAHEKYTEIGYCPIFARDAITKAYEAYHALGGNGTITELYNQIMAMPTDIDAHG